MKTLAGVHFTINTIFQAYKRLSADAKEYGNKCGYTHKKDYKLAKMCFKNTMKIVKRNRRLGITNYDT